MDYSNRLKISYYKTVAVINEMHNIFLVQHQETKKIYVKKILDVYDFQIYAFLQHNKIVGILGVIEICEENHRLTVIEEFISGASLQEIMELGQLSISSLIHYMCGLCDILERLHSLNPPIIHRDIKPSNIIVTSYDHVMLIDFNAAKHLTDASTSDTVLLGTKGYAAPEQYGFGSSTSQTDIYALGILLKELSLALPVPTDKFDKIIQKCTQINPSDRFESVAALKQEMIKSSGKPSELSSRAFTWQFLVPPGYRTRTPWKMLVSTMSYLLVFCLSLSLEVKDTFGAAVWAERIICLCVMLSIIFISFNYCDIQRFLPLCKNKNQILHYIGIFLLDFIVIFLLFLILFIFRSIFLTWAL